MKKGIHPTYYPKAKVTCGCGATYEIGSTSPELHIEICAACHPFYTGTSKLVDTAGRVDRFKIRLEKKTVGKANEKKGAKPHEDKKETNISTKLNIKENK